MVQQLTALLHDFTNQHCAWVSGNSLHAHHIKLFAVKTYYCLNKLVDKLFSVPLRLCHLIILGLKKYEKQLNYYLKDDKKIFANSYHAVDVATFGTQ